MVDAFLALNFVVAFGLFGLGLYAIVGKESLIRILLGLEVMGKGVTLSFLAAGFAVNQLGTAQAIIFTIVVIEVVVTAIALALMIRIGQRTGRLDVGVIRRLSG